MRRNISTRFHHIGCANPLLEMIDRETERIQRRHLPIRSFTINVDRPHHRHHKGNQVRVSINIALPQKSIFVSKEVGGMTERDNAFTALDRAFGAAENAVDQYFEQKRFKGTVDTTPAFPASDGRAAPTPSATELGDAI
jgi:hypothetical protein